MTARAECELEIAASILTLMKLDGGGGDHLIAGGAGEDGCGCEMMMENSWDLERMLLMD